MPSPSFALLAAALLTATGATSLRAAPEPFSHAGWTQVLQRFVNDRGMVAYEALARDRADFDRYLVRVESTGPQNHPEQFSSRNDRLAYYLNAYNTEVFKGVLARGPEKESVWTGGFLPGRTGYAFFKGMDITVGGAKTNLKALEDEVIRREFKDPRVHAALNCASKGCPRLPREAFEGSRLDSQLDAAMGEFVSEKRNCTVDDAARTVTLSKILDWFSEDFLAYEAAHGNPGGSQIDYVNRHRGAAGKVPRDYGIKFFDYDKDLNKQ